MKKILSLLLCAVMIISLNMVSFEVSAKNKSYVKSFTISSSKSTIYLKNKKIIKATVRVYKKASKRVKVKSSSPKVASVKVGKPNKKGISSIYIMSKRTGKTTITVSTVSKNKKNKRYIKYIAITVKKKAKKPLKIAPKKVTVSNKKPRVLYSGEQIKLNATVSPSNATDKKITWISSNPYIASVDNSGLVTAKSAGTVQITAVSSYANVSASSTIRVNQTTSYIENGTYCFKLKGTSSFLDHQGGVTNGTNIHLWEGDGNSNSNQKINIQRVDDNRNLLWSASSTNLMIDVNRGSSYSDPIKIGLNIDLWQNNDWEAQEWLFTKTYDGYYIIRLNMHQEGALEASGTNNGANIFFGSYNTENDLQKWQLVNTDGVVIPEKDGWICNTNPVGNVNVRTGPDTKYSSIGGFNEGQKITIIGEPTSGWYKVRGTNRHNSSTITGFVFGKYVTIVPPVVPDPPVVSGPSKQDGVNWATSRIGQWIDKDGYYGAQCKDFVNAYTDDLFNVVFSGDAKDLIDATMPSGWLKIKNYAEFVPEPGDIAIWGSWNGNPYGHTAVIISANVNRFVSIDQNWVNASSNGSPAAKVTHNYTSPKFWGVIRPPFRG